MFSLKKQLQSRLRSARFPLRAAFTVWLIYVCWIMLNYSSPVIYPKTNIVFLKTHKCAGSTIQNILMRYGEAKELNFVLPVKNNYLGHPKPFNRSLVAHPLLPCYNILTHHTRLDYTEIRRLMPNNTVFVTILREPGKLFESLFYYYGIDRKFKNISLFLSVSHGYKLGRFSQKFGFNQMMFDLGADAAIFNNETLVLEYIQKLEDWFDLVMITDRMEESLILLRHLLGWELEDMVVFKVNARTQNFKELLTKEQEEKLRKLNSADYMLYDHFLRIFQRNVKAFGAERMALEIDELREKTKMWYDACVDDQQNSPDAKGKTMPNSKRRRVERLRSSNKNNTCSSLVRQELVYTELLRKKQMKRYLKNASCATEDL